MVKTRVEDTLNSDVLSVIENGNSSFVLVPNSDSKFQVTLEKAKHEVLDSLLRHSYVYSHTCRVWRDSGAPVASFWKKQRCTTNLTAEQFLFMFNGEAGGRFTIADHVIFFYKDEGAVSTLLVMLPQVSQYALSVSAAQRVVILAKLFNEGFLGCKYVSTPLGKYTIFTRMSLEEAACQAEAAEGDVANDTVELPTAVAYGLPTMDQIVKPEE